MLTDFIVVIIWQYIPIENHYSVHFKSGKNKNKIIIFSDGKSLLRWALSHQHF